MNKLLTSIITLVPNVIQLFKKPTPQIGKDITSAGKSLLVAGVTASGSVSIIDSSLLDDTTALIVAMTQFLGALSAFIGTIVIAVGKSQTTNNQIE